MRVAFDARLYRRSAIESSIADYGDVAELTLEEKDGQFIVKAAALPENFKNIFEDEFSNYVLARMLA